MVPEEVAVKLIFATLFLGESRMAVVVEDDDGKQRRIEVKWMAADQSDLPPPSWLEMVRGEVEERRTQEKRPNIMGLMR